LRTEIPQRNTSSDFWPEHLCPFPLIFHFGGRKLCVRNYHDVVFGMSWQRLCTLGVGKIETPALLLSFWLVSFFKIDKDIVVHGISMQGAIEREIKYKVGKHKNLAKFIPMDA